MSRKKHRVANLSVKNQAAGKRTQRIQGQASWLVRGQVDDVLTTGVTVSECARKLKEAGAGRVHLFVLAIADHGKWGGLAAGFNPEGMLLL